MNEPDLYAAITKVQKNGVHTILQMYGKNMQSITEKDTVLDIGCGIGDITRNILLPFSGNAGHIVAGDVSTSALKYGRNHYPHDRLTYEYMDVRKDVENVTKWSPFARVYSFYCLHWVKDHESCLKNISSLLSPIAGECLLAFVIESHILYFNQIANDQRWADYMSDIELFLPNKYDLATAVPEFRSMMEGAKLKVLSCELVPMCFEFDNVQHYKDFIRSINPFYVRVPEGEREEFLNECFLQVIKNEPPNTNGGYPLTLTYTMLVAHGKMK